MHCYLETIEYYLKTFKELKKPEDVTRLGFCINNNVIFTAYMLNSLGEAYSKILQTMPKAIVSGNEADRNFFLLCKKKFSAYYDALFTLMKSGKAEYGKKRFKHSCEGMGNKFHEAYFRNYGCGLERIWKIEQDCLDDKERKERLIEIFENYKMAIEICIADNKIEKNAFSVWFSLYRRYMNKVLQLDQNANEEKLDKNEVFELIGKFVEISEKYAEYLLLAMPDNLLFIKHFAFVQQDIYWLYHERKEYSRCAKAFGKLQELLPMLNILYASEDGKDDYIKQIFFRWKKIENCEKKRQTGLNRRFITPNLTWRNGKRNCPNKKKPYIVPTAGRNSKKIRCVPRCGKK